jgi:hypothetical protein
MTEEKVYSLVSTLNKISPNNLSGMMLISHFQILITGEYDQAQEYLERASTLLSLNKKRLEMKVNRPIDEEEQKSAQFQNFKDLDKICTPAAKISGDDSNLGEITETNMGWASIFKIPVKRKELLNSKLKQFLPSVYLDQCLNSLKIYQETGEGREIDRILKVFGLDMNGYAFPMKIKFQVKLKFNI